MAHGAFDMTLSVRGVSSYISHRLVVGGFVSRDEDSRVPSGNIPRSGSEILSFYRSVGTHTARLIMLTAPNPDSELPTAFNPPTRVTMAMFTTTCGAAEVRLASNPLIY